MAGEGQGAQVHHTAKREPARPPVRVSALARGTGGSRLMADGTTYDARVYRTEVYQGSEVTT